MAEHENPAGPEGAPFRSEPVGAGLLSRATNCPDDCSCRPVLTQGGAGATHRMTRVMGSQDPQGERPGRGKMRGERCPSMHSGAVDDRAPRIRTRSGRSQHLGQLHAPCPPPWTGPRTLRTPSVPLLWALSRAVCCHCTAPAPVRADASVSPDRERLPPGRPTLTPTPG